MTFGFNGQMKSPEIGEDSYTALYWEYSSPTGRRWNLDPKPNPSVSPYATFENNPIWNTDVLGDSIAPGRTKGVNFMVVPSKTMRDADIKSHGGKLNSAYWADYKKAMKMERKSGGTLKVIQTDKAADAINQIKGSLSPDQYVANLTIDFHRSSDPTFDDGNFNNGSIKTAFEDLANGYIGKESNVYLGMCWSGGNAGVGHNDLTQKTSTWFDGATTYGHQAANSAIGFYFTNQFKGYIGEEYAKTPENKSGKGIHTVSYFSPALKLIRSVEVKEKVYIENSGKIHMRSKVNLNSLPTAIPAGSAVPPAIHFTPSSQSIVLPSP